MKLFSTNNRSNIVDLKEATLNAFPIDKGLYMPLSIEKLPDQFFNNLSQLSFQDIAFAIASNLIGNYIDSQELRTIIDKAINFPAPVINITDNISVLELFHGPTLAFKDFGARFMAQLMSYFLKDEDQKTTILVATSGDTGGAVAAGFHKVEGIEVIILYPSGKVSPLQEKQLTTWGHNIKAVEIEGTFDDCQRLVKTAFLDNDLCKKFNFSSANSINIARLIPQSFYYFEAYKQLELEGKEVAFAVPSGNFGNLTAGLFAKKMGLPINKFLAATNINNTVPRYLSSGSYNPIPSIPTVSNAMDVGNPSNFSRILELYGSTWNTIKENIVGYSYNDIQTLETITRIKDKYNYTLDPHSAIGYLACEEYLRTNISKCILLETAHPSKFFEIVNKRINKNVEIPKRLSRFLTEVKKASYCANEFNAFKSYLLNN